MTRNRSERGFQEMEAGKDRETLPICFPHVERFALKELPAVYEISFAVLPEKGLVVVECQLVVQVVLLKAAYLP